MPSPASLMQAFSRRLLAPLCLVCGEPGAHALDLCAACRGELRWTAGACRQCALPRPPGETHCGACRLAPPPFERTQAVLHYGFPVDALLPRYKFHGDLAAGALLATLMHWGIDPAQPPGALVPVPLHRGRLRARGYDQALELARQLSRELRIPLRADRLRRTRATQAQSELGAEARRGNVHGAFHLATGPPLPAHVALVDDVMTTGATVGECARVLLAGGVQRVDVWAIARA